MWNIFITVTINSINNLSRYKDNKLLIFSVTPFKIDQNKNQNHSIDNVRNLGNERRLIYKDPRKDSGQKNIPYTRYPRKCFTQIYRDLYGDAMLVPTWIGTNMEDENQQKHLLPSLVQNREFIPRGTHKHWSNTFFNTWTVKIAKFLEIRHFFYVPDSSLSRHVNATSRKSLEI